MGGGKKFLNLIAIVVATASFTTNNSSDIYQKIFQSIDSQNLLQQLKNLTGVNSLTVNGQTFKISERFTASSKAKFRLYFRHYFESLGMKVQEFTFDTEYGKDRGETQGHNLEAVFPGKSNDSIIVITHYDSVGSDQKDAENPGVDDDMTGMATMFEAARVLSLFRGKTKYTVRFVATDYEESYFMQGAHEYANAIKNLSESQNFKVIAGLDNEQSGWNCAKDNLCHDDTHGDTFDIYSCSTWFWRNATELGDLFEDIAKRYSDLKVERRCMDANSDHYELLKVGIKAVTYGEHRLFNNPYFDYHGQDTYDHIDEKYYLKIARIGVTFTARLAEIESE